MSSLNREEHGLDSVLLSNGDKRGILHLATQQYPSSVQARSGLLSSLRNAFSFVGLPNGFYGVMDNHDAIVSGSFVPFFENPGFAKTWGGNAYVPKDIDLYVGKGKLAGFLESLANLPGVTLQFLSRTRAITDTIAPPETPEVYDAAYYNNGAIYSMVRLKLENEGGVGCSMDVMEAKSASPLICLAEYDLSHLRAGISSEGMYILHPTWHEDNTTYVSPKLRTQMQNGDLRPYSRRFMEKYEDQGYRVVQGAPSVTNGGHICYASTECPLTLRSTKDDGVLFVPFTEQAALKLGSGQSMTLQTPLVHWRHGGECAAAPGVWEDTTAYDDDGIVIEHQPVSAEAIATHQCEEAV